MMCTCATDTQCPAHTPQPTGINDLMQALEKSIEKKPAVWKYQLPWEDVTSVEMPFGAKILHIGIQPTDEPVGFAIFLWARVHPDAELRTRRFRIAGTGHPLDVQGFDVGDHLGSVITPDGSLVFHVFEEAQVY